jgi:hypothetical protein
LIFWQHESVHLSGNVCMPRSSNWRSVFADY